MSDTLATAGGTGLAIARWLLRAQALRRGTPMGLVGNPADWSVKGNKAATDKIIGKQGAGNTPNARVGKAFDTPRYYDDSTTPSTPQSPVAVAAAPLSDLTIKSHPVFSTPIAAPGPVDHSKDMNPFSLPAGGSLLPSGAMTMRPTMPQPGAGAPPPAGYGMSTPWAQMNQGGAGGNMAPPPQTQPAFPSPGIMGGAGQPMPTSAPPTQGGAGGNMTPQGPLMGMGLMHPGVMPMGGQGMGPNAFTGAAMGGTQGPALIQKFMQMLHGQGNPWGN